MARARKILTLHISGPRGWNNIRATRIASATAASFSSILAWFSAMVACWVCISFITARTLLLLSRGWRRLDRRKQRNAQQTHRDNGGSDNSFHRGQDCNNVEQISIPRPQCLRTRVDPGSCGAVIACVPPLRSLTSGYGRPGNAPIAKSFPSAGSGAAAAAKPAHSPGAACSSCAISCSRKWRRIPSSRNLRPRELRGTPRDENDRPEEDFKEEFDQLAKLDDEWRDYMAQSSSYSGRSQEDEEKRQFFFDSIATQETLQQHLDGATEPNRARAATIARPRSSSSATSTTTASSRPRRKRWR